jgi:Family of unknown function (DUF6165)
MPSNGEAILAPVAIGELIDKITILEIKAERIADPGKLRNVGHELAELRTIRSQVGLDRADMELHARELKLLNTALWEIEDEIRELEAKKDFGPRFIALARSIYQTNDKRAAVKNRINQAFGSAIVEEKSYKGG